MRPNTGGFADGRSAHASTRAGSTSEERSNPEPLIAPSPATLGQCRAGLFPLEAEIQHRAGAFNEARDP